MAYYTQEKIARAKEIDLLTYLRNYEPRELVRVNSHEYCTREHDSLRISNGKWMWFSRGFGGYTALDYLIKVKGYSFLEAMGTLSQQVENMPPAFLIPKPKEQNSRVILPKRNSTNNTVKGYLESRGIDSNLIDYLFNKGLIYESEMPYKNAIFVGVDENGTHKHASFRATNGTRTLGDAAGSMKAYSFNIIEKKNSTLNVFESAIDMLSYITFMILYEEDWNKENFLALSGVYSPKDSSKKMNIPIAIERILKCTNTDTIKLHLDNDRAGRLAAKGLEDVLKEKYKVINDPPIVGKDYNDYLCSYLGLNNRKEPEYER